MAIDNVIGDQPAVVAVTTTKNALGLNNLRRYLIVHDGVSTDGTTAANETVFVSYGDTTPPVTGAVAANVFRLPSGRGVTIGPGITAISLKCASGTPTVSVVPDGELVANA